jgi:hypothetical protein
VTVLAALSTRGRPIDLGLAISRAIGQLQRNWLRFTLLSVIVAGAPYALLNWGLFALHVPTRGAPSWLAYALVRAPLETLTVGLVGAMMTTVVAADRQGRRASMGECLRALGKVWRPFLVVILLKTAAIAVAYASWVTTIVVAAIWPVATQALVIECGSAFRAFRRSATLSRGSRWRLALVYLILSFLIGFVIGFVGFTVPALFPVLPLSARAAWLAPLGLLSASASALLGQVWAATLYFELRTLKEGVPPESLASVFD